MNRTPPDSGRLDSLSPANSCPNSIERDTTVASGQDPPIVSVIVIFLDAASFLPDAIESIRSQTFTHWEVLLVDDGSSDGSTALARSICARDPDRYRFLEHPEHENRGMSASRNLGIAAARGRYLAFLDADDMYLPSRLAEHAAILDAMPQVDMVQSDHVWWHDWQPIAERFDEDHRRPFAWAFDGIVAAPEALLTIFAAPLLSTATCSITVRRSVAQAVGGFEESFRTLYEDQAFLTKIYLRGPIYALRACLAKVRVHRLSCTNAIAASAHRTDGTWQSQTRALILWQASYLRTHAPTNPVIEKLMQEKLRTLSLLPYQGWVIALRSRIYRALRMLVPRDRYLGIMRWRRRMLEHRTRQQCHRLHAMRTAGPGHPIDRNQANPQSIE